MKKEVYPEWKKIAWRFVRVFFGTFGATFLLQLMAGLGTDQTMVAIATSALSGGIVAGAKALRAYIRTNYPKAYEVVKKIII